jgi:hypothetical protein
MTLRSDWLPFQVEEVDEPAGVTALAGVPLVIEAFRRWGLAEAVRQRVRLKRRRRGYDEASCVETLVALLAAGGECVDDVRVLEADAGLKRLWGRTRLPAAATLRRFLNGCHDPAEEEERLPHRAFIPRTSAGLQGLEGLQERLLAELQRRAPQPCATLDVDATVIVAEKRTALPLYEGARGYQPLGVWWAEQGVWVTSQFRDGNVPAQSGVLEQVQRAVARLRRLGLTRFAVRSDSAGYQHVLLDWLREQGIPFAISADMNREMQAAIAELPEESWRPFRQWQQAELVHEDREWAEVVFVPDPERGRAGRPDRYLVIRARPRQLPLFADGAAYHYYATVTNRWDWDGERLLRWSHERCGSIEPAHDVLKNELGGGVLPSYRFGANAAWWQLVVLTANLLVALKRLALPAEWALLRPRRLRFLLFARAGRIVQHGRRLILRLARDHPGTAAFLAARPLLAG